VFRFQGINGAGAELCDPRGSDGRLYLVGGVEYAAEATRAFLQVYDASTNTWAIKTPPPFGATASAAAGAGGKVFYLAGRKFESGAW
jgi:hypothetical protein